MAVYYSSFLKVPHSLFEKKGVFDGYVGADVKLHIDPLRLKSTKIKEFAGSYENVFLKYFNRFVLFVDHMESNREDDTFFKLIVENFMFQEIPNVGLGYSEKGSSGTGISGALAKQLARSTVQIIKSGMREPELFVFMHLFEKNIGADRISDMTVHILRHQILQYTARIAGEMRLPVYRYRLEDYDYQVPFYKGLPLHFVPTSLLADLPVAKSFEDISKVENYNTEIKRKVCNAVKGEWKAYVTGPYQKQVLKNALMNSRKAYDEAINYYRSLVGESYDFNTDKKHFYFEARIKEIVDDALNGKSVSGKLTTQDVVNATKEAIALYKKCLENHRSYKLMYYEKDSIAKSEDYAQELLYVLSEAYLKAKGFDIDVSPEADTGVGKLDFKFSQGSNSRVIIETKLSNNKDLLHGFVTQLPDYMKAQDAVYGIYVVVIVDSPNNQKSQMRKLWEIKSKSALNNKEIVFVSAEERPTASKRK